MTTSEPGIFEILGSTRAMKRLKPDPVPEELLRKMLDAGTKAPSGVNTQPWEFLVVRDPETKKWIQERYLHFTQERFGPLVELLEGVDTPHARMLRTVMHLAEHLHEVPVLLFVCGHRDWPAAVPVENRLGEEGQGTLAMMRNLEIERLTLAAMSVGIARRCVEVMLAYANQRKSFGVLIREHGQVQRYIAESFAEYRAARVLVYETARRMDLSAVGQRVDADAAKLFASQVGKRAADAAIQVLGGYGYMGEYVVERLWRDAKLLEIGGGTLEAHHKNLIKDLSQDPSQVGR